MVARTCSEPGVTSSWQRARRPRADAWRATEAARLPEALASRYETLRSRLAGIGAARIVDGRCGGCHLSLPSVELDRIKHLAPDAVVTCDQCGRILVRPSLAGGR